MEMHSVFWVKYHLIESQPNSGKKSIELRIYETVNI